MPKIFTSLLLLLAVITAGCSAISKYDDDEPAAIVRGQEITVGELRLMHPDDRVFDYLDWAITSEVVKQEVQAMNLDISKKLEAAGDDFAYLPPKNAADYEGGQIRKYAESQAAKLNMTPEQFQRAYAEKINEQNAYLITYLEAKLGEEKVNGQGNAIEFDEEADELLQQLLEENKDEIEVLIKR